MPKSESSHSELRISIPNAQLVYTFHSSAVTLSIEEAAEVSQNGTTDDAPSAPKRSPVGFSAENQ